MVIRSFFPAKYFSPVVRVIAFREHASSGHVKERYNVTVIAIVFLQLTCISVLTTTVHLWREWHCYFPEFSKHFTTSQWNTCNLRNNFQDFSTLKRFYVIQSVIHQKCLQLSTHHPRKKIFFFSDHPDGNVEWFNSPHSGALFYNFMWRTDYSQAPNKRSSRIRTWNNAVAKAEQLHPSHLLHL